MELEKFSRTKKPILGLEVSLWGRILVAEDQSIS